MPLNRVALVAPLVLAAAVAAETPVPQGPGGPGVGPGAAVGGAPRTGTALMVGRVVEGTTNRTVSEAIVQLIGAGAQAQRVVTDADGYFVFRNLPSGEFTVQAVKAGFLLGSSGQRVPRGPSRPIEVSDGERLGNVTLRLWKYGVISGVIQDDRGDPVSGVQIGLTERTAVTGRTPLTFGAGRFATTDDRGVYRIPSVAPGDYLVYARSEPEAGGALQSLVMSDLSSMTSLLMRVMSAGTNPEDLIEIDPTMKAYPLTFYPAAATASQASIVSVKSGEERSGVDFRLKLVPLAHVRGIVTDQGQPVAQMAIRLVVADDAGQEIPISTELTDSDGRFGFLGIPAGRYLLRGTLVPRLPPDTLGRGMAPGRGRGMPPTTLPKGPTLSVTTTITVGEPGTGALALIAERGVPWRGRVVFEGSAPVPDDLTQISFALAAADGTPFELASGIRGRTEADRTFATLGVPAGKFLLRATAPPPLRLRSAIAGGRDLIDVAGESPATELTDIIATFVDRPDATLSGTVTTPRGDPDPEAIVFVFAADPRLRSDLTPQARRLHAARARKTGYYAVPGLPPGEYLVAVGTDESYTNWLDPAVLERLSRSAVRVSIADGTSKTQDLRSGGAR
jgi:Carboxypeptidase regulatory-like domain